MANRCGHVSEFRLVTNQFLAEHGRAAGSVVDVVTKSGTNDFDGSLFWSNNNKLNSLSNLDKSAGFKEAPYRVENQIGGTIGGPITKDSTFFFGSLQLWTDRLLSSGNTITGIPTEAGKQALQAVGWPLQESVVGTIVMVVLNFLVGILAIWLYVAIRPRFGPGLMTATIAGVAASIFFGIFPDIGWGSSSTASPGRPQQRR